MLRVFRRASDVEPSRGAASDEDGRHSAPQGEVEIRASLCRWISGHAKMASPPEVRDDTPLLERGLLSSLEIVELVLFIESLRGSAVDGDALEPETFESVDSIYRGFFG